MAKQKVKVVCKNVFKNGANVPEKNQYTKKWITVINQLEKNKR